jgi:hypothetical protein
LHDEEDNENIVQAVVQKRYGDQNRRLSMTNQLQELGVQRPAYARNNTRA